MHGHFNTAVVVVIWISDRGSIVLIPKFVLFQAQIKYVLFQASINAINPIHFLPKLDSIQMGDSAGKELQKAEMKKASRPRHVGRLKRESTHGIKMPLGTYLARMQGEEESKEKDSSLKELFEELKITKDKLAVACNENEAKMGSIEKTHEELVKSS